MEKSGYDVIIVGSGAGGATLARELSKMGALRIAVIEQGLYMQEVGTFNRALKFYDCNPVTMLPKYTKEGVILWRSLMAGGSTVVSLANQMPTSERALQQFGIDLSSIWLEVAGEMGVAPLDDVLISEGTKVIATAAQSVGCTFRPMPKAIATEKCVHCAVCPTGCPYDAKWTALRYVNEAAENGVEFIYDRNVDRIWLENGQARGVIIITSQGEERIEASQVVLAAGGIGTAQILRRSRIESAGKALFMDVFVSVVGVHEHLNLLNEPSMSMVCDQYHASDGFILSPYIPVHRLSAFAEFGLPGLTLPRKRLIGLMVKTKDDMVGEVFPDGAVSKQLTDADWARLNTGSALAKEILEAAGVSKSSLLVSRPQGAHPGGTAAIGLVVDEHLGVKGIRNLYACDASVLPVAPGLPPIMTIVALAKWFSRSEAFR